MLHLALIHESIESLVGRILHNNSVPSCFWFAVIVMTWDKTVVQRRVCNTLNLVFNRKMILKGIQKQQRKDLFALSSPREHLYHINI
jgi:hypothetical protein